VFLLPVPVVKVLTGRTRCGVVTCREEILAAFDALQKRSAREDFSPAEIIAEMERSGSRYPPETIRTEIASRMCTGAPRHHATFYDDLERVDRGRYRLRSNAVSADSRESTPSAAKARRGHDEPTSSEVSLQGADTNPYGRDLNRQAIVAHLGTYLGDRQPTSRYASFDYCFNYFQAHREEDRLAALAGPEQLELSCLQLGFYLASWGMLRGSSELLQRSVKSLVPVIEAIAAAPDELWTIDADHYSPGACDAITRFARVLRGVLHPGASDILVTKIILGTTGCIPAFDTNFKRGFGVSSFTPSALRQVGTFYQHNVAVIEEHREATLDFHTGSPTQRRYTRAKVIDMIFFIEGMRDREPAD